MKKSISTRFTRPSVLYSKINSGFALAAFLGLPVLSMGISAQACLESNLTLNWTGKGALGDLISVQATSTQITLTEAGSGDRVQLSRRPKTGQKGELFESQLGSETDQWCVRTVIAGAESELKCGFDFFQHDPKSEQALGSSDYRFESKDKKVYQWISLSVDKDGFLRIHPQVIMNVMMGDTNPAHAEDRVEIRVKPSRVTTEVGEERHLTIRYYPNVGPAAAEPATEIEKVVPAGAKDIGIVDQTLDFGAQSATQKLRLFGCEAVTPANSVAGQAPAALAKDPGKEVAKDDLKAKELGKVPAVPAALPLVSPAATEAKPAPSAN